MIGNGQAHDAGQNAQSHAFDSTFLGPRAAPVLWVASATPEAQAEGVNTDDVLLKILDAVPEKAEDRVAAKAG